MMGNKDQQVGDGGSFDRTVNAINRGIYKASVYGSQSSPPSQTANTSNTSVDFSMSPETTPTTGEERLKYLLGAILCFAITLFIWYVAPWTFIFFWIVPVGGLIYLLTALSKN
jgi:hypothetical protein